MSLSKTSSRENNLLGGTNSCAQMRSHDHVLKRAMFTECPCCFCPTPLTKIHSYNIAPLKTHVHVLESFGCAQHTSIILPTSLQNIFTNLSMQGCSSNNYHGARLSIQDIYRTLAKFFDDASKQWPLKQYQKAMIVHQVTYRSSQIMYPCGSVATCQNTLVFCKQSTMMEIHKLKKTSYQYINTI